MKRFVLSAAALAVLSGLTLATPADAASYKRHYGKISPAERVAIVRSKHHLNSLKWKVRADRHVTPWERVRVHTAQARHRALVRRLRHN